MRKIIVLGSGDAVSDERVQAGLAVPLDNGETLLIDTTSGPVLLRQLRKAGLMLAGIRHIFISHRHFDHVGGLAPLLAALVAVPEARIVVYASPDTLHALRVLLSLVLPGVENWIGPRLRWYALAEDVTIEAGSTLVTPFAVDHGLDCLGFRLALDGATAVFSADTRPCPTLIASARGVDLLIHEAYGPASMAAEAHAFGHSTAVDAGVSARTAGVKRLLLTHLRDSRYADPAVLAVEAAEVFGHPVELASDLGTVDI